MKITMFLVTLTLLCTLVPFANAQMDESTIWTAKVPYSFRVENTQLPAGEYLFKWNSGRLLITSADGNNKVAVISLPLEGKKTVEKSTLQFSTYGTEHFLSSIWFAGREQGREFMKSKLEVELARKQAPMQVAVLLAK